MTWEQINDACDDAQATMLAITRELGFASSYLEDAITAASSVERTWTQHMFATEALEELHDALARMEELFAKARRATEVQP